MYNNILSSKISQVLCRHVCFIFNWISLPMLVPPYHKTHATPLAQCGDGLRATFRIEFYPFLERLVASSHKTFVPFGNGFRVERTIRSVF